MTEQEYIRVSTLAKISSALKILRDIRCAGINMKASEEIDDMVLKLRCWEVEFFKELNEGEATQ